ncbi:DUF1007 family protein [Halomonas sp. Bachu 37]|uniref:DUF1007 family protein n=1 Tax=Halomonas kashgarensis TaxID=3084920 RepID=UPI003216F105
MIRAIVMGVLALWCGVMTTAAWAHPHGWIDMSIEVLTDEADVMQGLRQTWRMDPFYSLIVMEELQQVQGGDLEAGLDQLGGEIRDNLASHGYFTELHLDDEALATGEVEEYTVMERQGRVVFMFILPLAEPHSLAGKTLRYQVFDPSYYLEMVHDAENDEPTAEALRVTGGVACERRIIPADPDPDKVMEAALLDADQESAPGLGRYFAETGEVACG